nr:mucin-5AC-like [Ciona intestinalis]|eukprot:XP_026690447.1 mucin-5AC-like [Ciona intestinalis]
MSKRHPYNHTKVYPDRNALINQAIRRRRIVWDLMPGVLYEFNVRTRSNNVLSDSSSVSDRMPPDTPGFISIDHLTSTTANLSWGEPHRGIYDGFVVEIDPVDGGVEQPGLPTDKRRNLFGLTPGVRYLVEVYATSHGVLSYKPRNRTIEVPPMPPMRPVVASNVQSTAVTLSWQVPVHGRLDHFEVVYYPTLNDYRRLRHKVHDPLVTLTNLLPNTEYSLILFSVTNHTNLVFSKPLLATVRTGQYETTAIYRTTTSLAGVVVTAKDEGEEEGNENLVGGTEDPAKTASQTSLIDRIKSATTPKPDVNTIANGRTLPPHYSIPDVLSTIKPFPTTKYYQGRVTTYPSLNVNTETTDSWRTSSESASPTHAAETFTTAAMVRSTTRFPVVFRTTTNKFLVSTTFAPDKIKDTTTMTMLSTTKANGGPVEAVETTASQPKPRDQGKGDQTTPSPDMTVVFKPGDTASTANKSVATATTSSTTDEYVATTTTTTSSTTDKSVATATTSSTTDESVAKTTTTTTSSTTDESVAATTSSTTGESVATTTSSTTDESVAATTSSTADESQQPSSTTDESVATTTTSSTTDESVATTTSSTTDESVATTTTTTTSSTTNESVATTTSSTTDESVATTTSSTTDESVATTTSSTTDESVATTTSSTTDESGAPTTSSTTDESVATTTSSTTDESVATTTSSTTDESVATTTSSTTDESVATTTSSTTDESVATTTSSTTNESVVATTTSSTTDESVATTTSSTTDESVATTTSSATDESVATTTSSTTDESVATTTSSATDESVATTTSSATDESVATTTSSTTDESVATTTSSATDESVATTTSSTTDESVATTTSSATDESVATTTSSATDESVATTTSSATDESVATTTSSATDESVATTTSSATDESVATTTSSATDESVATTTSSTTDESVATTTSSTTDESVATKVSSSTTQSTSKTDKPIIRGGSGKTTTDSTNKTDSTPTKTKPGVNDSPPTTHATKQPSADASFSTTTPFSPLEPTEPLTTTYPVVVTGDVEVIPTTAVNQIGSGEGPTSDNGTTSNGGSEMTVGQDEGRTNRIQQGYSTICRPNNITVLVDKAVIANYERKYGPLHLNDELDPRCVGVEHPTYYRYTIAPNLMDCGTTIELNDTHVNFTNTVSNNKYRNEWYRNITDHGGTVILGNRAARNPGVFVNMRIWCTFPLDLSVSMAYPFLPQITQQVLTFNISGHGQFSAAMQLYKSNAYDDPYIAPPTLQSNETLYVGISLLETHNSTFMVVKRCWGTPERAHDHPRQYPIISDYCRVPESLGGSVKVMGNGEGRKVKWEGSVFKFIDFQQVWLHCEIRVCFGDDCKPDCEETTSRRKRSANSDGGSVHVISAGPISLDRPRGPVVESVASGTTTSPEAPAVDMEKTTVLIAVGGLCFVILICLIVIVGVLVRLHKKRRLQKNQNSSTESTTAFESRNFEAPVPDGSDYFEISRSTSHLQSFTPPPSSSGHGRVESSIRTVSQLKTVSNDNAAFLGSNSDISSANKNINDKHNVAPNTNKTPGSGVTSHGANVIS